MTKYSSEWQLVSAAYGLCMSVRLCVCACVCVLVWRRGGGKCEGALVITKLERVMNGLCSRCRSTEAPIPAAAVSRGLMAALLPPALSSVR